MIEKTTVITPMMMILVSLPHVGQHESAQLYGRNAYQAGALLEIACIAGRLKVFNPNNNSFVFYPIVFNRT